VSSGAAWGRIHRATVVVIAAALLALFVREAVVARPFVGGQDFTYEVLVSRDLANGVRDLPDARYEHLPGLQHFWRLAILAGGGSLASLQWIYLAVLALDLVLVGALARRIGGSAEAVLLAVVWTFTLDGALQVYLACGETIALLPCLAGVLAWSGKPLRGREGLLRAIALGAGLGLAVYVKRQAGLVALGAAALLPARLAREGAEPEATAPHAAEASRPEWRALVAIPLAALSVFLTGILLEGRGLEPLRISLGVLARYQAYGSALENELLVVRGCPALLVGPALLVAWVVQLARRRPDPFLGFAAIAASAVLLQFTKRPYAHHALLAAPFLALGVVALGRALPARASPVFLALALLLGAPLAHARYAGPPESERPWPTDEATRAEVAALARHVHPGEDVLLLPPEGRNELHWILGTTARSNPLGYGWAPELAISLDGVRWPTVDAVIVLRPRSDYDLLHWVNHGCWPVVASLPDRGFAPVFSGAVITVYRRKSG